MNKLYKTPYFDKIKWILEYFDKLNLTPNEAMVLVLIEFAHESGYKDTIEFISTKMNLKLEDVDSILSGLVSKQYITLNEGGYSFNIDNVFEFDPSKYEIINNQDVFQIFEEFLNRPLTGDELNKISNLVNEYGEDTVIDALRKAEAYDKHSISYIESVLLNEAKSFKTNN